ncbi:MAG TPA: FprA family A-type flavoprotein [Bacteroidales bacterium]|nr:FprA family A-type flavoprotein [Bacteroidales bacterium]
MSEKFKINRFVHYVGVNDRKTHLFENLWPLPLGVSYNAYLVVGEKIALIDTVESCYASELLEMIVRTVGNRPLDYLIVNHMEPDHSSSINVIRQAYPGIQILGNAKTTQMLEGYYGAHQGIIEVKEGDSLCLGGETLRFYLTPMVHWPETMMTYCEQEQLLFSGDAFGTFGALNGAVLDQDMDLSPYWDEMYRYYANIVGKYGSPVQKALQKLSGLDIRVICPTHGPVWKKELNKVVGIYDKLSRYEGEKGVVIAYGSMYGNTARTAMRMSKELASLGLETVVMHNLSVSSLSDVLRDVFKYRGLVIGSPTYNAGLFPPVEALVNALAARNVKNKVYACFGSFTWAGAAAKKLQEFGVTMNWEIAGEAVELKQGYSREKTEACAMLAKNLVAKL